MWRGTVRGAGDVDRIQGVVTELHPQGFVLATEGRTVVVDMAGLGGITMALAKGQAIVAIGTNAGGSRRTAWNVLPFGEYSTRGGVPG
jgi:hypothetical protein